MSKEELRECIFVTGRIVNMSPLVIGNGEGDFSDVEILKDDDGWPYIPGTSFFGAVKSFIIKNYDTESKLNKTIFDYLFGSEESQSHFIVNDMFALNKDSNKDTPVEVRDAIRINLSYDVVDEQAKYDFEIVSKKLEFNFMWEIKLFSFEFAKREIILKFLKTILKDLNEGKIRIGAMTNKGFGKILLKDCEILDFRFPEHAYEYFDFIVSKTKDSKNMLKILDDDNIGTLDTKGIDRFSIKALFSIKSSLIIGKFEPDILEVKQPDKTHLKWDDKPTLAGKSIRGAIRKRAIQILNTISNNAEISNDIINELFGYVCENHSRSDKNLTGKKGKLYIEESQIDNVTEDVQTRIKIDRFTGGVIEGALFQSKPVWNKDEKPNFAMELWLEDPKDEEIGLILLILKDLWVGDLAIGGEKSIGRGVLQGISADICIGKQNISIYKDRETLKIENGTADDLERYVQALLRRLER